MSTSKTAKPKPRRKSGTAGGSTFQSRVDYVAKALRRGSWGRKFDECFELHDSNHLIAVIMLRAEKNAELREAIVQRFEVSSWDDVPWRDVMVQFAGMSSRQIGIEAERVREEQEKRFRDLYRHPEKILEDDA